MESRPSYLDESFSKAFHDKLLDQLGPKRWPLEKAVNVAYEAGKAAPRDPTTIFYPIKPKIYGCSDLVFDQ